MNQITKAQFVSLLLIEDLFVLFCLTDEISLMTVVGFSAGVILQALISKPLIDLYSDGRSLKDCGKVAEILLLVYLIMWGGALFSMLWNTSGVIYIPYENSGFFGKFLVAFLIGIVCVYMSSSGIKALGRSALIAAAVGAVCLIIVTVSAFIRSDAENIVKTEGADFFHEFSRGLALSGGTGSFVVLLGFTRGKPLHNAECYFSAKIIMMSVVILTGVTVTGGIMEITDFPIVLAAQLSQPFSVQRIDSLFLIVFSVSAVYSIAVQASMADYLLSRAAPFMKKYRSTAVLVLMAAAGFLFGGNIFHGIIYGTLTSLVLVSAPVVYSLRRRLKNG